MKCIFKCDSQGLSKYTRKIGVYSSKVYDFERSDKIINALIYAQNSGKIQWSYLTIIRRNRGKYFGVLKYVYLQLPFIIIIKKSAHVIYINNFIPVFIQLSKIYWSYKYSLMHYYVSESVLGSKDCCSHRFCILLKGRDTTVSAMKNITTRGRIEKA